MARNVFDFAPFQRKVPSCPECKRPARIAAGRCVWCNCQSFVPIAYFRWLWFLALLTCAAIGIPMFSSLHAGTWLLVLIFLSIPIRVVWGMLVPPWVERGPFKAPIPLMAFFVSMCFVNLGYWTLWGWLHLGLGASRSELSENWEIFSVPLGWIHPSFVIRSDKWLLDAYGILMGNSFFDALLMFVAYSIVRNRLNRGNAIRLKITDGESEDGS